MTTLKSAATVLAKRKKRETIRVVVCWDPNPGPPEPGVKVITWEENYVEIKPDEWSNDEPTNHQKTL